MSKSGKILFGIFLALLGILVYLEASTPQEVSWFESYNKNDKIPFGTYVLFNLLEDNPEIDLKEVSQPPYEFLTYSEFSGSYFFLNDYVAFDDAEMDKILDWTRQGNTLYITARGIGSNLLDSLNLQTELLRDSKDYDKQPIINFSNPKVKQDSAYHFKRYSNLQYFSEIDTLNTTVLGYAEFLEEDKTIKKYHVNFIKVNFGEGHIVLNLFPKGYTNYFLLEDNNVHYAENALAYLDNTQTIYWDNHYKSGKSFQTSLLYVLFSNRYFKWAYYMVLITTLLFVFFEGKRKQRSIKVIEPLKNKTYDYTKTISEMYLDSKDHKGIINKQIALFLEYIRTELRLDTHTQDKLFFEQLSSRLNKDMGKAEALFKYLETTASKPSPSKSDVMEVHQRIEKFKS